MGEAMEQGKSFTVELDGDGIAHLRFRPGATVDMTDIRELESAMQRLGGGEKLPIIAHMQNLESADREARSEGSKLDIAIAAALVTGPGIGRTIGNFYMAINKPSVPTKMFATEEEARSWLMTLRR